MWVWMCVVWGVDVSVGVGGCECVCCVCGGCCVGVFMCVFCMFVWMCDCKCVYMYIPVSSTTQSLAQIKQFSIESTSDK